MAKAELKVEVDEQLLARAHAAGIQLSLLVERALEAALATATGDERASGWAAENVEAIEDHRLRIERLGVFADDLRTW